jgi:hypothetical protein
MNNRQQIVFNPSLPHQNREYPVHDQGDTLAILCWQKNNENTKGVGIVGSTSRFTPGRH